MTNRERNMYFASPLAPYGLQNVQQLDVTDNRLVRHEKGPGRDIITVTGHVEISSQHSSQALLRPEAHGRLLDDAGGLLGQRAEVRAVMWRSDVQRLKFKVATPLAITSTVGASVDP